MSDDGFSAPPIGPENIVYPKTWYEAFQYLLRRVADPGAPDVSLRDLPRLTPIDEIVAVQPMKAPIEGLEIKWVGPDDPEYESLVSAADKERWRSDGEKTRGHKT